MERYITKTKGVLCVMRMRKRDENKEPLGSTKAKTFVLGFSQVATRVLTHRHDLSLLIRPAFCSRQFLLFSINSQKRSPFKILLHPRQLVFHLSNNRRDVFVSVSRNSCALFTFAIVQRCFFLIR